MAFRNVRANPRGKECPGNGVVESWSREAMRGFDLKHPGGCEARRESMENRSAAARDSPRNGTRGGGSTNAPPTQSAACGWPPRRAYRPLRSCGRVAEGGGLLNRYRVVKPYRGFESLRLRQYIKLVQSFERLIAGARHGSCCRPGGSDAAAQFRLLSFESAILGIEGPPQIACDAGKESPAGVNSHNCD